MWREEKETPKEKPTTPLYSKFQLVGRGIAVGKFSETTAHRKASI